MSSSEARPCYICGSVFHDKMKLGMHIVKCYEAALASGRTDVVPPEAVVEEGYTRVVMKDPKAAFADMKRALKAAANHDTTRKKVSEEMKAELEKLRKLREAEEARVNKAMKGGVSSSPSTERDDREEEKNRIAEEMKQELARMRHIREEQEAVLARQRTKVPTPSPSPAQGGNNTAPTGWTEFMVTYPRPVIDDKPLSRNQRERHKAQQAMRHEEQQYRRQLEEERKEKGKVPSPSQERRRPPSQERSVASPQAQPPKVRFCPTCGRPFPPERLAVHSSICKRVAEKNAAAIRS